MSENKVDIVGLKLTGKMRGHHLTLVLWKINPKWPTRGARLIVPLSELLAQLLRASAPGMRNADHHRFEPGLLVALYKYHLPCTE